MRSFFVALEFLTRISILRLEEWRAEDFGRSVRWFPLVGAVLGLCYGAAAAFLFLFLPAQGIVPPKHVSTAFLLLLTVLLTGGLFCDGFMDSMDGIFSGRPRDRMLEIMKDSRVGSFGVIALACLLLVNWTALRDVKLVLIMTALFVMPIIGRMAMVMAIAFFPYARKEGMGKIFADMADRETVVLAAAVTLVFVVPWGQAAIAALVIGLGFAWLMATWLVHKLGGLTGDTYGAIETLTETVVLLVFWVTSWIPGGLHILWR